MVMMDVELGTFGHVSAFCCYCCCSCCRDVLLVLRKVYKSEQLGDCPAGLLAKCNLENTCRLALNRIPWRKRMVQISTISPLRVDGQVTRSMFIICWISKLLDKAGCSTAVENLCLIRFDRKEGGRGGRPMFASTLKSPECQVGIECCGEFGRGFQSGMWKNCIGNPLHVLSSLFRLIQTLFRVFQVKNSQK